MSQTDAKTLARVWRRSESPCGGYLTKLVPAVPSGDERGRLSATLTGVALDTGVYEVTFRKVEE